MILQARLRLAHGSEGFRNASLDNRVIAISGRLIHVQHWGFFTLLIDETA